MKAGGEVCGAEAEGRGAGKRAFYARGGNVCAVYRFGVGNAGGEMEERPHAHPLWRTHVGCERWNGEGGEGARTRMISGMTPCALSHSGNVIYLVNLYGEYKAGA